MAPPLLPRGRAAATTRAPAPAARAAALRGRAPARAWAARRRRRRWSCWKVRGSGDGARFRQFFFVTCSGSDRGCRPGLAAAPASPAGSTSMPCTPPPGLHTTHPQPCRRPCPPPPPCCPAGNADLEEQPAKGLFALPFMQRALERKKLEAQQQAQQVGGVGGGGGVGGDARKRGRPAAAAPASRLRCSTRVLPSCLRETTARTPRLLTAAAPLSSVPLARVRCWPSWRGTVPPPAQTPPAAPAAWPSPAPAWTSGSSGSGWHGWRRAATWRAMR